MGIREFIFGPRLEEAEPVQRTSALFEQQVGDFWAGLSGTSGASNPRLLERVWVASRCLHMNSNAISTMPLRHFGGREPAWVANPDPVWFPNGISDAVYAIVCSLYGWGDAFLYITARYADGYPSAWTVLDPAGISVETRRGARYYRSGQVPLDASDMVQISRNPQAGSNRGTSAIASYSAYTNGLLAAADLGRVMMQSDVPQYALLSKRKLTREQAEALQAQWVTRTAARRGAPPVVPPEIDLEKLSFSVSDLMLLDAQKFDAQVIATAFGIPAQLVNLPIEGGLNYQTPALLLELWWRSELLPTAAHVAAALSSNMLARGSYVEFDARRFVAPTFAELVAAWKVIVADMGAASIEEFRTAVLGLPPEADPIQDLAAPPSAGASPAQQPATITPLRPASSGTGY